MEQTKRVAEMTSENVREAIREFAGAGRITEIPEKFFIAFGEEVAAARDKYKEAAEKFEKNLTAQERRLVEKVSDLKKVYAEKIAEANNKGTEMAQAVAAGESEKALECEHAIDSLNAEAFTIEKKIKTLETTRAVGDKELYTEVTEEYGCYVALMEVVRAGIEEYEKILTETLEALEKNKQNAREVKKHFAEPAAGSYEVTQQIRFYESVFGPIDVRGHHAGTEENAKARFICGNLAGIENTKAGEKLAEMLGIDIEELKQEENEEPRSSVYRNPERMNRGFDPEEHNRKWKGLDTAPGNVRE